MSIYEGKGAKDWKHDEFFPADFLLRGRLFEKHIIIAGPKGGSIKAQVSTFDDFVLSEISVSTNEPTSCICKGVGKTVSLYFNLGGSCTISQTGGHLQVTAEHHTIYYSPDYHERAELFPENGKIEMLEINVPIPFYTTLFSGYSQLQDAFIANIQNNQQVSLSEMLPMTLPMKWILNTIKQNQRTGLLKRIFLEAKILELLMLQVEQAEIRNRHLRESSATRSGHEALHEARAILERSPDNPPTIKHLARLVGMNEFDLKRGFKEIFQDTIYGFVNKIKMQQAKQMLIEGNRSIQEVALLSGYKNPQHFTTAFKKYFGVLPSKIDKV
jgi:AraC-like DNA-binding protein